VQQIWNKLGRIGAAAMFALAIAAILTGAHRAGFSADKSVVELSPQAAGELAKVTDQLNQLAIKFDADKDKALSSAEQAEMLKFIGEKFGAAWEVRGRDFLRAADVDVDGEVALVEWERAINKLRQPGSGSPKKGFEKTAVEKETVMLPMSDGARLATDIYRPSGKGPFPVVFTRTPYSRLKAGGMATRLFGYVLVAQDMRGRFDSEGENLPFVGCGWGVHKDGVESLQWIRKQPWCNGRVCTIGGSAGGITQNMLAAAGAEGLTAQHISVAAASMYDHATYVGGALRKCQVENWSKTNRFDPKALQIILDHPAYDDYWRTQDTSLKFAAMNSPAMHVGGWFDTFAQGTIDSYVGRQHEGGPAARGTQKLVMGPWTHAVGKNPDDAELIFPDAQMPKQYDISRWLQHHLTGVDNGMMKEPAVIYYVMGDTRDSSAPGNQWRQADDWPIPHRDTPYFFSTDGKLGTNPPPASSAFAEYTFDPNDPCPTIGGKNLTIPRGPKNQNSLEKRSDVVLFTTELLAEPLEVTGRVRAKVFISSSAVDSDLSVRLCDVYPDGKSYIMAEGMLRLRYHKSLQKPELLTPGKIIEANVDCWSTSIVFNRGHRLRVTVTSSDYPRFDLNPGTGKPWVEGDPTEKQTNRIYCDAEHPSSILLPMVESMSTAKQ
jgi:predicted acyl esterase